nr:ribonuclease H-like domain-containing protein [Tanacetum cinerariifolium]
MASGSDRDTEDALSKLLQMGTVAKYQSEFEILINRVTGISEGILKAFYISGLKPTLQCALLRSNPTTLGEAFSLACATEARFAKDALSKLLQMELLRAMPTTLVKAFSLARMTEARFEDERTTTTIVNSNDLNIAIPDQVLEESILHTLDKVEITYDNDARDQDSEVETKVLVDGKQDDAKVMKVVGVAVEQNNDEPNVLEDNGVIGIEVNKINKWVDKEVQYSVSTLHVLISLLKRLNDKHIKKKTMKA